MGENDFKIIQISETSLIIEFGNEINEDTNRKIRILSEYLDNNSFYWLVEYIPYFCSISVIYDPLIINQKDPFNFVKNKIENILIKMDFSCNYKENIIEVPVCYGYEYGPDIEYVAQSNNLTINEVIEIHSSGRYLVYMIGFTPGFPYLGGLSEKLFTPRRKTPRIAVPSGSVGIAGMQTGIYPIETPGGWQIIGRTPLKMFDLNRENKTILKCGDIARFYPISTSEYLRLKEKIS